MTKTFTTERLRLGVALWAQETTSPNAGAGTAAPVGSLFMQSSGAGAVANELFLKLNATNTGWSRQNLVNLNIFNVKHYGATGDGVTDDLPAINAALADCVAQGGGGVYFPATPNYYRVVKPVGVSIVDLIDLTNVQNVTLFGDGYASKIKQEGTVALVGTHLIGITNRSSGIRIYNLYLDVANITEFQEQDHTVQVYGRSALPTPGPEDIEISGVYFGRSVGDAIRTLGAGTDRFVTNLRVLYCAFNLKENNPAGSRAGISAQRATRRIQFHYNWLQGGHDQQIDFEATSNEEGPSEWSILGNQIDHESQNVPCVTLSGSGNTFLNESKRTLYVYNLITNGGDVSGIKMRDTIILGNITKLTMTGQPLAVMSFYEFAGHMLIASNINKSLAAPSFDPFGRAALLGRIQNAQHPENWLITNNVLSTFDAAGATDIACVTLQDIVSVTMTGNMVSVHEDFANGVGILHDSINVDIEESLMTGNMVFKTGAVNMQFGYRFSVNTPGLTHFRNGMFRHNWLSGGAVQGYRWSNVADNWRGAVQNVGVDITSSMLTTAQAVCEGEVGPGSQIVSTLITAGPEGTVTSPSGSLATNLSGGQANVMFVKETGTGVSGGTTLWVRVGGDVVMMGALAGSTATAARFMAPGGLALAAEATVEIQWTAPRPGIVRNLRIRCTAGTGGGTNTYVVRKNGVNTTLTIGMLNTATSASDTTHSFTVGAGDLISLQVTKSGAPTTPQTNIVGTIGFI